jgi:hypothetical protein
MHRSDLDQAENALTMISIRVVRRYGSTTVRSSVTAPSVEEALELAGDGARVLFPIDGEVFFTSAKEISQATVDEGGH